MKKIADRKKNTDRNKRVRTETKGRGQKQKGADRNKRVQTETKGRGQRQKGTDKKTDRIKVCRHIW